MADNQPMVAQPERWVREALANPAVLEQLELHFQPVVWLTTGNVYGAESFVKWRHPERGIVPTATWLPHAVATGAIVRCTRAVLHTWAASSRGSSGPIVSLNFSGQQLIDQAFMAEVFAIPADVAAGLAIEIHQLQFRVDHANQVSPEVPWVTVPDLDEQMAAFQDHGFAVWLDDFGDGCDDESTISHPHIGAVKLDHRLLESDVASLSRVVGVIHAQSELAMIECIETAAHEQLARDAGIDLGQGFLYAQTLDGEGWDEFVQSRN